MKIDHEWFPRFVWVSQPAGDSGLGPCRTTNCRGLQGHAGAWACLDKHYCSGHIETFIFYYPLCEKGGRQEPSGPVWYGYLPVEQTVRGSSPWDGAPELSG